MRYDGFISYSHAADGQLAPSLQKALQRLGKPWYRRRSLEIFRDETGLSVDPHLWGAIVKALDDADWFVLLTSSRAAQSEWVNREIEHWKTHRSVDRILPVVTDGHWEWNEATGDFTEDSDAVPPALRGVFTDEPRHLDLRWAREEEQLELRDSRFRNAVAEIAAPLHGCTKDEIEGEDVRQHRRTLRIAWSAAATLAVLTVAAVVAGSIAVYNANRAEQRRIQAEAQRLAAQSQTELERPDLAFLLAAHGYRLDANVGTASALLTAVANMPEVKQRIPTGAPVTAVAISEAADRVWIGTADGDVIVHRFSDGEQVARSDAHLNREVVAMARSGDDSVVVTDGTVITTVDGEAATTLVRTPDDAILSLTVDTSTGRIAAGTGSGKVLVWEPDNTKAATTFAGVVDGTDGDYAWITALAWTPDGSLIVASQDGGLRRYNLDTPDAPVWQQQEATGPGGWVSTVIVVDDGTIVTGGTDGSIGFWDAATGTMTDAGRTATHLDSVRALAVTGDAPEDGSVASVSDDGALLYWNHLAGTPPLPPIRVDEQAATSVAWDTADPSHGVTGGQAGGAVLLDYGDDRRRPLAHTPTNLDNVATATISPAGDRLALVRVKSWREGEEDQVELVSELLLTDPDEVAATGPSAVIDADVKELAFTPDGTRLLAATDDGSVAVWDGHAPEVTVTTVAEDQPVNRLAVSPDGTTVVTGALDLNAETLDSATVRIWRLDGSTLVEQGRFDNMPYGYGLSFTPDGSRLVIGGANKLVILPLNGGETVTADFRDDSTRSLAVSPDGATVAVGLFSGPVRLIDAQTGEVTGDDLRVATRVSDMAFEEDGEVLVTVSEDGSLIMWDVASRTRFADRPLTAVKRSAVGTGQLTTSLGVARDLAVTASKADGRLAIWSLNPDDWIAEGCEVHRRKLSDAEKDRFELEGADPVCTE